MVRVSSNTAIRRDKRRTNVRRRLVAGYLDDLRVTDAFGAAFLVERLGDQQHEELVHAVRREQYALTQYERAGQSADARLSNLARVVCRAARAGTNHAQEILGRRRLVFGALRSAGGLRPRTVVREGHDLGAAHPCSLKPPRCCASVACVRHDVSDAAMRPAFLVILPERAEDPAAAAELRGHAYV
eukprot:2906461-Prymnesium_polylepis.1